MTAVASQGRLLARNTILNLLGQVVPAVAAIVFLPYTLHGLGIARFGILSLAWVLLGYLGLFDLGLGRATIRFVADNPIVVARIWLPGCCCSTQMVQPPSLEQTVKICLS